jgi:hypothetical protein
MTPISNTHYTYKPYKRPRSLVRLDYVLLLLVVLWASVAVLMYDTH